MDDQDMRDWEHQLSEILRIDAAERAHKASQLLSWQKQADEFMATKVRPAFQTIESLFASQSPEHHVTANFSSHELEEFSVEDSLNVDYAGASLRVEQPSGEIFAYEIGLIVSPEAVDLSIEATGAERSLSDENLIGAQAIMRIAAKDIVTAFLREYKAYLQRTR